jgi:hypothetical protein
MTLKERLVSRALEAAGKPPTFAQAQEAIFSHLKQNGWAVKTGLKIPYATSSDGKFRLWFKAQAVYFTIAEDGKHDYKNARTVSYSLDIRQMSPEEFAKNADFWRKHYGDSGHY